MPREPLSLADLTWPLVTERLVIRPLRPDDPVDLDGTWAYRRLPAVQQWQSGVPADRTEWEREYVEPANLMRALVVTRGDVVIGDLYLRVGDAWSQREVRERARGSEASIGYTLHPDHTGRGYATEGVRALVGACFTPVADGGLGLRRLTASCFAANEPSWRLMERVGMRREQHGVRDSLHRELGWVDGYTYGLLAEEWHRA